MAIIVVNRFSTFFKSAVMNKRNKPKNDSFRMFSYRAYIYISVETQQSSYNILTIYQLLHAFMQSSSLIDGAGEGR